VPMLTGRENRVTHANCKAQPLLPQSGTAFAPERGTRTPTTSSGACRPPRDENSDAPCASGATISAGTSSIRPPVVSVSSPSSSFRWINRHVPAAHHHGGDERMSSALEDNSILISEKVELERFGNPQHETHFLGQHLGRHVTIQDGVALSGRLASCRQKTRSPPSKPRTPPCAHRCRRCWSACGSWKGGDLLGWRHASMLHLLRNSA
jgi:hypothetical protein